MPQSYTNLLYHMIFSTKDREPFLNREMRPDLFAYVGGICRNIDGTLLSAGGYDDHVHLLVKLNAETSVAEAMRTIKAFSHELSPKQIARVIDGPGRYVCIKYAYQKANINSANNAVRKFDFGTMASNDSIVECCTPLIPT